MKNISPREAIEVLKDMKIDIPLPAAAVMQRKRNVAIDMAIDALKYSEMPNSSDSISRKMAIDEWKNDFKGYVNALNIPRDDYNGIMAYIDELPSAQQESCEDADKLKRCKFEYINACKTVAHPTPDARKNDIYDANAVIKALHPIFSDEDF